MTSIWRNDDVICQLYYYLTKFHFIIIITFPPTPPPPQAKSPGRIGLNYLYKRLCLERLCCVFWGGRVVWLVGKSRLHVAVLLLLNTTGSKNWHCFLMQYQLQSRLHCQLLHFGDRTVMRRGSGEVFQEWIAGAYSTVQKEFVLQADARVLSKHVKRTKVIDWAKSFKRSKGY